MKLFLLFLVCSNLYAADFLPKSFSFNFEQRFVSKISKKEKVSTGTLDYNFPGNIRFEIFDPDKIVFVSNGQKSWYYTAPFVEGEEGELTVKNNDKKMVLAKFFDALEKGLVDNEVYKVENIKEGKKIIFSTKSATELGIKDATLYFESSKTEFKALNKVLISYQDNRQTTMVVKAIKTDLGWGKDHFVFTPPPKTKISN